MPRVILTFYISCSSNNKKLFFHGQITYNRQYKRTLFGVFTYEKRLIYYYFAISRQDNYKVCKI